MDKSLDTPDRRFWTAYDHFKIEQEAREARRLAIAAMIRRLSQRVMQSLRGALAHAGAQPPKRDSARTPTAA